MFIITIAYYYYCLLLLLVRTILLFIIITIVYYCLLLLLLLLEGRQGAEGYRGRSREGTRSRQWLLVRQGLSTGCLPGPLSALARQSLLREDAGTGRWGEGSSRVAMGQTLARGRPR